MTRKRDETSEDTSEDEVAAAWDRNADIWAEHVRKGRDEYRELYNTPAFLEFIGDLAGKVVLDAGCGEGYNARMLAQRGARMTGVDISKKMIELARDAESQESLGIRYEVGSYTDLSIFQADSFDAVVSFMALMDGPDFPRAMREILRVLKRRGMLAFSILHPCFLTKGMAFIRDGGSLKLTVSGYFDNSPWVEQWVFGTAKKAGETRKFAIPRFDRTLSYYVNSIIDAGFKLEALNEPRPSEEACRQHPSLAQWRETAPTFLHVRASKPL
jgi:ubiquinone/menaquinone biosynthesis C-methylase UbiE